METINFATRKLDSERTAHSLEINTLREMHTSLAWFSAWIFNYLLFHSAFRFATVTLVIIWHNDNSLLRRRISGISWASLENFYCWYSTKVRAPREQTACKISSSSELIQFEIFSGTSAHGQLYHWRRVTSNWGFGWFLLKSSRGYVPLFQDIYDISN